MRNGLFAAGGLAVAAALTACSQRNEDKTSDAVAGDIISRYDRNGDFDLNKEFESTRDVPGSRCTSYIDTDQDGFGDTCLVTDNFVTRYSVAALLNQADSRGDKNGIASQREVADIVKQFDVGSANGKAIAGNNILEREEIEVFNRSYEETRLGEFD
jgi:hypothetical protein